MRRLSPTAAAALAFLAAAPAQQPPPEKLEPHEVQRALDAWRAENGPGWNLRHDEEIGRARLLFGQGPAASIRPVSEADWFGLARRVARETWPMHGIDPETLVEHRILFVPLGQVGTSDKMAVKLRQEVDGVPVEHGWLNLLFDTDGGLLAVDSTGLPGLAGFDARASLAPDRALSLAQAHFRRDTGLPPTTVGAPELIVSQIREGGLRRPHLAWRIDLQYLEPDFQPEGWEYFLDAATGSLLDRRTSIHDDVSGNVTSWLTPGTLPRTAYNGEVSEAMPDVEVTSAQGNAVTDANGDFTIVGAIHPLLVTVKYEGPWHDADNKSGSDFVLQQTLNLATGNSLRMNQSSQPLVTAQADSAKWVSGLRNWIRAIGPTDDTMDFRAKSNVNMNSTCNAYYNGSSVNFFLEGGGCVNTAYSTVVVHEMGHWANDRYGSGNGWDGFGEGAADVFAMFMTDQPIVGEDFSGQGTNIRTGLNTRLFCGDNNRGCYGEVHDDGEVLMGALWKARARMKLTMGASAGAATADALFSAWMNVYDDGSIHTIVEDHWLTLDDNDGNIYNGTPHFDDIDGGFRDQGFPGISPQYVTFSDVTILEDTLDPVSPRPVEADIIATYTPPVIGPELYWRTGGGGAYSSTPMSLVSGDTYTADIPPFPASTMVDYYLRAEDGLGQSNTFPDDAPEGTMSYMVGSLRIYCTAKTNSQGCDPAISTSGFPTTGGGPGDHFHIDGVDFLNNKNGILFYGFGSAGFPFQGGWMCVKPPIKRTAPTTSGGNAGAPDCSGSYHYDFGARIASGIDPGLAIGTTFFAQFWSRDPASSPHPTSLSNAVEATIAPSSSGMAFIPGGEFTMGDHHDVGSPHEQPVHATRISSFRMDPVEVSNQQYRDFLESANAQGLIRVTSGVVLRATGNGEPYCNTSSADPHSRILWDGLNFSVEAGKETHPMVEVSWYGAAAYANWRSTKDGLSACYDLDSWECDFQAGGYRLPTEAEWEYAARGGEHDPYLQYPWGDLIEGSQANYWGSGDPFETGPYPWTSPVGYYDGGQTPPGADMANGYGLYDMAGNALEWCNDWYESSYYNQSPYQDPRGPTSGAYRILRGGSWDFYGDDLRCAFRFSHLPGDRFYHYGFRLARD